LYCVCVNPIEHLDYRVQIVDWGIVSTHGREKNTAESVQFGRPKALSVFLPDRLCLLNGLDSFGGPVPKIQAASLRPGSSVGCRFARQWNLRLIALASLSILTRFAKDPEESEKKPRKKFSELRNQAILYANLEPEPVYSSKSSFLSPKPG
jgi:hypothetical protein